MFHVSINRNSTLEAVSEEAYLPLAEANIYGIPYSKGRILQKRRNSIVNSTSSQLC